MQGQGTPSLHPGLTSSTFTRFSWYKALRATIFLYPLRSIDNTGASKEEKELSPASKRPGPFLVAHLE